jgi:hypothetical protein
MFGVVFGSHGLQDLMGSLTASDFEKKIADQWLQPHATAHFLFCPHGCASAAAANGLGGPNHAKEVKFISNFKPVDEIITHPHH